MCASNADDFQRMKSWNFIQQVHSLRVLTGEWEDEKERRGKARVDAVPGRP
jgi:hypothetical protein